MPVTRAGGSCEDQSVCRNLESYHCRLHLPLLPADQIRTPPLDKIRNSAPVDCSGKPALAAEGSTAQKGAMEVFIQAYRAKCANNQVAYTASVPVTGLNNLMAVLSILAARIRR